MNLSNISADCIPVLSIRSATVVKGSKHLLTDLNLEIAEGRHTAILGPNGCGKSSLIKLISRQYYPVVRAGINPRVSIFGQERWNVFELRALLGIVSADLHQAFTGESAVSGLETVLSGFFASQGIARHHAVTPEMQAKAEEALMQVDAAHLHSKPMNEMSTGEARRILIARALVSDPRALLLDEPTTGLDIAARRRFLDTLRRLARQGRTTILVTHHVEEIIPEIERVVLMQGGSIVLDGEKSEMLTSENLTAVYGQKIQVRRHDNYFAAEVG